MTADDASQSAADEPPAPGWWKASDGHWYPPQPGDRTDQSYGCLKVTIVMVALLVLVVGFLVLVIAFLGAPADDASPNTLRRADPVVHVENRRPR